MEATHLQVCLGEELLAKAEKAAALLGLESAAEYIVQLINDDATRVIKAHQNCTVTDSVFDEFVAVCDKAQEPNQRLLNAASISQDSGIK